ncbi:MAG TPA: MraY family glycosyltransferase [Actinocrinis sp.]|nr:MraY family glycosyltransferase [Actinocrinis sp.]
MTVGALPSAGPAVAAAATSALLSEPLRRLALRSGLVDCPGVRKAHQRPTPYLGGVAIAVATLLPTFPLLRATESGLPVMAAAAVAVCVLGLADDVRPLSPLLRLAAEAGAASLVVSAGARLPLFGNALDGAISVLFIVLLTNAFNLLDNMDGVAAAVGAGTSASLAAGAALAGRGDLAVLLSALSAGCAGFLFHNWAPARIFMGDAGSLFIGFVLATATLAVLRPYPAIAAGTAAWLVGFVPMLDTAVVLVSRHRARRPLLQGGTDHLSHRLRVLGLSGPRIALVLFAAATSTSLTGLFVARRALPAWGVLPLGAASAIGLVLFAQRIPVYPRGRDQHSPSSS